MNQALSVTPSAARRRTSWNATPSSAGVPTSRRCGWKNVLVHPARPRASSRAAARMSEVPEERQTGGGEQPLVLAAAREVQAQREITAQRKTVLHPVEARRVPVAEQRAAGAREE